MISESACHEARAIITLIDRGLMTEAEGRDLINVTPGQMEQLRRFGEDAARVAATRRRILAEFDRLIDQRQKAPTCA